MNSLNIQLAKSLVSYVEREHKFPAVLKVGNVSYNYGTFNEILANTIVNINSKHTGKTYGNAPAPTGDTINIQINKTDYIKLAREIVTFYNTNKRSPNYVEYNKKKIKPQLFGYCFAKILVFFIANKRMPTSCTFNSNVFTTNNSTKIVSNDEVFNYFVKVFGNVSTIDEALQKVKEHGYAYYYDDTYTNRQSIDRMKARKGINCTDSCQVFYHIAKALGYTVNVLHVYCNGTGGGHVRLQLKHSKHTGGKWINRDPACVLSQNGKPITSIWCEGGKLLDTNGAWFMKNVNR